MGFSSSQHSSPWPWQLLRSRPQAPTLTLRPILGTATTAMEATGEATEATTDPTATMATTERGLLMNPLKPLDPTLTPLPILGTATTAMEATEATMVATTDPTAMATMARGLLMRPPLPSLAPTLMLRLTPGTDTTATDTTGHMDMDIMVLATVDTTGDKKWTSRTTSDLFLPTHL